MKNTTSASTGANAASASASSAFAGHADLLEPTPYELAAAWAEEENQNFAMLETAKRLAELSCPAACQIIQLVLDRMRDCVPEEDLLNRLCPMDLH